MSERSRWELQGIFKLCFAVAISPTSPYKRRNWLYSADQDGDSEWRGPGPGPGGVAERAPKQAARAGQQGGESIPKGLLSFIPKIESSISIQPTTLQDWK